LLAFCKHSENIFQFFNLHKKFKIFFTLDYRAGLVSGIQRPRLCTVRIAELFTYPVLQAVPPWITT